MKGKRKLDNFLLKKCKMWTKRVKEIIIVGVFKLIRDKHKKKSVQTIRGRGR